MRRSVEELHAFYAGPLGAAAVAAVRPRLVEAWGDARGLDVLALGYGGPLLPAWPQARRVVAAMPAGGGAHAWPPLARNAAALVEEGALPFANALFDRLLVAHLLEEAEDPLGWLAEAARVLAPAGRLMCVAASRSGAWARAEGTPFGHGRPYSRTQLMAALRTAGLEPQGSARVLYAPPLSALAPAAAVFEAAGRAVRSPLSGLVMVEAVKHAFAPRPAGRRARVRAGPVFAPAAVGVRRQAWPSR